MTYSSDEDDDDSSPELETLDISNDQYYRALPGFKPKTSIDYRNLTLPQYGSSTIKHSLPAYDLWKPFYPTYLGEQKFRNFHRPKLRHYNTGPQSKCYHKRAKPYPIKNLTRTIFRFQKKLRYKIIRAITHGSSREEILNKYLLIANSRDLTSKNGELFLFEYSEEFPPVLSQIGMAANVTNLIQKGKNLSQIPMQQTIKNNLLMTNGNSTSQDDATNNNNNNYNSFNQGSQNSDLKSIPKTNNNYYSGNYKIGANRMIDDGNTTKQLYYSQLTTGSRLQVLENNLYRAPIYAHHDSGCDFLIIRTRNSIYIRCIKTLFTVGQTMPLVAIPQPNENAISRFRCELSNRYIHKLFMESDSEPGYMKFSQLTKLFPDYNEQALLRRMKVQGVSFDRPSGIVYRGSSKYGYLSLRELRQSFTPEQYCLNMAMLAARERLRELNYTESMINPDNDDAELETEVLAAPWNTSRAILRAMTGKNYLDFKNHLIDPTGPSKEGFSCVVWSKSPTEDKQTKDQQQGGDQLMNKQSEQVTPVGYTSNSAPIVMKNPLADKIRREKLERLSLYKREAKMIFETQSKVLSSNENLSSDEDNDDEEEDMEDEENTFNESFDEQLRDLTKLIFEGQTINQLSFEKEEEERRKMIKEFNGKHIEKLNKPQSQQAGATSGNAINTIDYRNKFLKITRTYNINGDHIERTEIVRDPKIIALYVKRKGVGFAQSTSPEETNSPESHTNDILNQTTATCGVTGQRKQKERRSSVSLGPSELCRADGMVLTISKKVLNGRLMRTKRRRSATQESF